MKNIAGLINKVGDSLSFLKNGTKNSLVMGELEDLIGKSLTFIESWVGIVGLITVLGSTPLMWPINLGLNPTPFLETACTLLL